MARTSPDGPHVAILTYGYWQSDFGGDPGVIGRTIQLDGKPVTVVGVLPADFQFSPANNPLWVPLHPIRRQRNAPKLPLT